MCSHVVENFSKELEAIDYVQTFKALKSRYEQHQDKLKDRDRATLERYVDNQLPRDQIDSDSIITSIFINFILIYLCFIINTVYHRFYATAGIDGTNGS